MQLLQFLQITDYIFKFERKRDKQLKHTVYEDTVQIAFAYKTRVQIRLRNSQDIHPWPNISKRIDRRIENKWMKFCVYNNEPFTVCIFFNCRKNNLDWVVRRFMGFFVKMKFRRYIFGGRLRVGNIFKKYMIFTRNK